MLDNSRRVGLGPEGCGSHGRVLNRRVASTDILQAGFGDHPKSKRSYTYETTGRWSRPSCNSNFQK